MSFYLDASVILPTLIEAPASARVDRFMRCLDPSPVISEFASAETASALSRLVRTGLMDVTDATERLADFDAWRAASATDVDLQPADVRLANLFVRRFDLMLRAPDALHLALCRRHDLTLATLDRRMAQAAEALGVRVEALDG